MTEIFAAYLLPLALLCVLAALGLGVIGMLRGGEFNEKYGNKLMRARVASQALAVILLLVTVYLKTSSG